MTDVRMQVTLNETESGMLMSLASIGCALVDGTLKIEDGKTAAGQVSLAQASQMMTLACAEFRRGVYDLKKWCAMMDRIEACSRAAFGDTHHLDFGLPPMPPGERERRTAEGGP